VCVCVCVCVCDMLSTHVEGLLALVLGPDEGRLDDVQVGARHRDRSVSAVDGRDKAGEGVRMSVCACVYVCTCSHSHSHTHTHTHIHTHTHAYMTGVREKSKRRPQQRTTGKEAFNFTFERI